MTVTIPRPYLKALGVVFTSLAAPVGVHLLTDTGHDAPAVLLAPDPAPAVPAAEPPAGHTRVVAQGTGPTPEAAFRDALDGALQRSVAAELTAADWARFGPAYLAAVRRDGDGVVRGWRELSATGERHLTGRVYRSEVAVDVDVAALRDRLRAAGRPAGR